MDLLRLKINLIKEAKDLLETIKKKMKRKMMSKLLLTQFFFLLSIKNLTPM